MILLCRQFLTGLPSFLSLPKEWQGRRKWRGRRVHEILICNPKMSSGIWLLSGNHHLFSPDFWSTFPCVILFLPYYSRIYTRIHFRSPITCHFLISFLIQSLETIRKRLPKWVIWERFRQRIDTEVFVVMRQEGKLSPLHLFCRHFFSHPSNEMWSWCDMLRFTHQVTG